MSTGTRSEHYLFFAVSFIAAIWFFVGYPSQDPRSAAEVSYSEEEVEAIAAEKLSELGFSISNYTREGVSLRAERSLLDSLQYQLGRKEAAKMLRTDKQVNSEAFYWEVIFQKNKSLGMQSADRQGGTRNEMLKIRLDTDGTFLGFANESDQLPHKKVQRRALGSVFSSPDGGQQVMPAVSDSLLDRLLYFDLQKEFGSYNDYERKPIEQIRTNFRRGIPYRYTQNDARAIADYYLTNTGWSLHTLQLDTIFVKRINSVNAANVRYKSKVLSSGQQLQVDAVVAPTGALLQLNPSYGNNANGENTADFVWGIIHIFLIFGLAVAGLIVFFFRMRARAIDTQSALVVAVLMGLMVPAFIFLSELNSINPFTGDATMNEVVLLFLRMGIMGAFSSVGFFVLFAVSDSITRQNWPAKLSTYDYVRQGMILNKPVGMMLLRGVGLSFILSGFWTLLISLFPHVYLSFDNVFLYNEAALSPVYLFFKNGWFSIGTILAIFLVIGGRAYGQSKNPWITGFFTTLGSAIIIPVFFAFGPIYYDFLIGGLLGALLTYAYVRWDFLTLLLGHFLFLGLLDSVTGWIVTNSPDTLSFVLYIGFMTMLTIVGFVAVYIGKEERSLPKYVPSYVEELAQEQRIKQELQIAREVQQSFLPAKIPAMPGLDIAAVCQPAYETGGDYYDFIPLDDHRVAVAIGDVSGKGIQAAFYMTFVKGMLHSLCHETDSPAKVLSKANRLFCDNATKGTFVSLVYGVIDLEKRTFTFARAGHNPILHVRASTGGIEELQPHGLGIGLTREKVFDNKIREIELSITEDDLFLLYTDGIVEALNQNHEFYGTKKLARLIRKKNDKPASQIVSAISKGVTRFIGNAKQHDDMTLMAIRFTNKEK